MNKIMKYRGSGLYFLNRKKDTEPVKVEGKYISPIEKAVNDCKKAFSKLEENLYPPTPPKFGSEEYLDGNYNNKFSGELKRLSKTTLNADRSFLNLKDWIGKANYSLNEFNHGMDIENNLEELKRKVSVYKKLESSAGKIITVAGISSIPGLIGYYFGSAMAYPPDERILQGLTAGTAFAIIVGVPSSIIMSEIGKNIITVFIQRSHHPPIENIVKYSDSFFSDLEEKLKSDDHSR